MLGAKIAQHQRKRVAVEQLIQIVYTAPLGVRREGCLKVPKEYIGHRSTQPEQQYPAHDRG